MDKLLEFQNNIFIKIEHAKKIEDKIETETKTMTKEINNLEGLVKNNG